jgi:hypothetical protein
LSTRIWRSSIWTRSSSAERGPEAKASWAGGGSGEGGGAAASRRLAVRLQGGAGGRQPASSEAIAQALGEAAAALVGGDRQRLGAGGGEAFAAGGGEQLGHPELGLADGAGGGAVGAGQRQGGDEGALDLGVPAVGAGGAAGDGGEIEEGAERFERVPAGEALGTAAVADDGDGGHDSQLLFHEGAENINSTNSYFASGFFGGAREAPLPFRELRVGRSPGTI